MRPFPVISMLLLAGGGAASAASPVPPTPQHERRSEDGVQAAFHWRDFQSWHPGQALTAGSTQGLRAGWMQAIGLDLVFTYDALAMSSLSSDESRGGNSGDATLNMHWQITDKHSKSPLSLNARARHRHAYDDSAPSGLRATTGALWGLVDGFTDAGFQAPEFYLEDRLFDRRLTLRYGQMSIDDLLDGHELRSAKRSFMNQAFSSSPAVGFPGSDLGFVARWQSRNHWELALAVSNVAGSNLRETTQWRLEAGALFEAVQAAWHFQGIHQQAARLQLLAWRADALPDENLPSGRGLSLTYEQPLSTRYRVFLKYAWADGQASATQHFASVGLARDFNARTRAGVALAAGNSSRHQDDWQSVLELFYRRQFGKSWMITPDVQFLAGENLAQGHNVVAIVGVRLGMTF